MNGTYLRGELYFADLTRGIGSEQNGRRPVVIIQNNVGNKYSPTVIVASITSKIGAKGDLKAVQGDGGWNTPDMITKRYAHILDEDRRKLAEEMDASFYGNKPEETLQTALTPDLAAVLELFKSNPELIAQALQTVQLANKA